jgi:hypothetical protein
LSDDAAKALANSVGFVSLLGLTELSEEAEASLLANDKIQIGDVEDEDDY